VPFALTAGFVKLIAVIGLVSATPMAPVSADALPPRAGGTAAVAAAVLVLILGWIGVRPMLLRGLGVRGQLSRPGAATATALVGCAVVVVVWIANAFAAAILLVALHAWMLVLLSEERPRRGVRVGALIAGLLPPAFVVLYYADVMGFGPLATLWNGFLVAASSRLGLGDVVVWSLLLACLAAVGAILRAVPPPAPPPPVTVRGPATYAGPGSLGGTKSALRR
jgi:hypothetical protein